MIKTTIPPARQATDPRECESPARCRVLQDQRQLLGIGRYRRILAKAELTAPPMETMPSPLAQAQAQP